MTITPGRLSLSAPRLAELGLSPPFEILAEANLVGWQELWPPLSLDQAVATAFDNSPALQSTRATVAADNTAVASSWSAWSPQVGASVSASQIDPKVASAFQAQTTVTGALTAQQLIYSDGARVNVNMQRDLRTSRMHELSAAEQDLTYQVIASYIGLLRRRALVDLYRADLDRVRLSLDVARERMRVGDVAESEVFRWESEIASTRANLTAAWVDVMSSTMKVNQVCGRPASELFVPAPTGEDLPDLTQLLTSPKKLEAVRMAAGRAAQSMAPVVQQLDSVVSARERYARSTRRAYFMPTVAGQFSVNANVYQSELAQVAPPPDLYWTVGGSISLPLFEGMGRRATQRESNHDLAATQQQRERSRQAVTVQAMDAVNQAYGAATRARLGQDQVEAVHRSLDASLDAYARGATTLTTITEARTASLKAEIAATDSRYEAIQRMYDVLYATGSLATPNEPERPLALRNTLRSSLEAP
ncbi:MAG: outer membrane protein [Kiritimatiellia bacterium]